MGLPPSLDIVEDEVGKFPQEAARCLVPLLLQDLISLEAVVGDGFWWEGGPPAKLAVLANFSALVS